MQERTLSSAWTFWAKFIFPAIWISGFGVGAILVWSGDFVDGNHAAPPPQIKFVFAGLWMAGATFILWANAGLKRVRIDEQQLHVSNYLQEIDIPFSAITDVSQNRWLNSRPVTIHFGYTTELGDTATFMPKQRLRIRFWHIDPVVDELKQLAGISGPEPSA